MDDAPGNAGETGSDHREKKSGHRRKKLSLAGYKIAEIIYVYNDPSFSTYAPLVVLSGHSSTMKGVIAYQLESQNNGFYRDWSKFIDDIGLYGEKAAEKELVEPLVYALRAYEAIIIISREFPVILDGVKDVRVMQFLEEATRRPIVPLFFKTGESIRRACARMRRDEDDAFDENGVLCLKTG